MKIAAALGALLPALAASTPGLLVEEAAPGGRRVVLAFEDSVRPPDLASLRVDGYSIEHAVFLEEIDSLVPSADLWDLTTPKGPRLAQFAPGGDSGTLWIDAPVGQAPRPGTILADTAGRGLLVKVTETRPVSGGNGFTRHWVRVQPAFLNEALMQGEIRFRMRLDLGSLLPEQKVQAQLEAKDSGEGEMEIEFQQGRFAFQPSVYGGFRVRNGLLENMQLRLQGDLEVFGSFAASARGHGRFSYEKILESRRAMVIPLGHGLSLRLRKGFTLRVEAEMGGDEISGKLVQKHRQAVSADLTFNLNRWQPAGDIRDLFSEAREYAFKGQGALRFALEPRLELSLGGNRGPTLVFSPSARLSSGRPPLPGNAPMAWTSPARSGAPKGSMAFKGNALFLQAPSVSTSVPPRNFLLHSLERPWLSPPLEGWATVAEGDSESVTLQYRADPPADYFEVQRLAPNGTWKTIIPKATGARLRVDGLRPGEESRFRFIGYNAHGAGPAFPEDGLAYTPSAPSPLLADLPVPVPIGPDTSAPGDTGVLLAWTLPGEAVPGVFNVYFGNRDSLQPVAQSLRETQFRIRDLDSGWTYYWRVEFVSGTRFSQGPLRHFTYRGRDARPPADELPRELPHGFVLIPGGTFQRSDKRAIAVRPFYLQKYEVLQSDYRRVMGGNPSFHVNDSLPVERVTWDEAARFCRELGARLPTEAEWEYAARGGAAERFPWGKQAAARFARFRENSQNRTWPPGSLRPNAYGLYDMMGNVFEWVRDWHGDYGAVLSNPNGPAAGTAKVIRGASWYSEASSLDPASRFSNRPGFRNYKVGFRCAQDAAGGALSSAGP